MLKMLKNGHGPLTGTGEQGKIFIRLIRTPVESKQHISVILLLPAMERVQAHFFFTSINGNQTLFVVVVVVLLGRNTSVWHRIVQATLLACFRI